MSTEVLVSSDDDGPWHDIARSLRSRPSGSKVRAAIGYVAGTAPTVLTLQRGDVLVCDASEHAVRMGMTDPAVLLDWLQREVEIYSLRGLHAKVVVGRRTAWVGSANASINSKTVLVEAAIRTTDANVVGQLRDWVDGIAATALPLDSEHLERLIAEKPEHPFRGPGERAGLALPSTARRIHLVELSEEASPQATKRADTGLRQSQQLAIRSSALDWAEMPDDLPIRVEDWWIDVTPGGRLGRPAKVLRLDPFGRGRQQIVWVERAADCRLPSRKALSEAIGGPLPAEHLEIRTKATINRILDLYRDDA